MKAYPTLRILSSALLLALAACGTSTLGGGSGGAGTGGTGTGTGPWSDSGDHTISVAGLSVACTKDSDCTTVYTGDACSGCNCATTPLAVSAQAAYESQVSLESEGCCTMPKPCPCPNASSACVGGSCALATP